MSPRRKINSSNSYIPSVCHPIPSPSLPPPPKRLVNETFRLVVLKSINKSVTPNDAFYPPKVSWNTKTKKKNIFQPPPPPTEKLQQHQKCYEILQQQ